MQYPSQEQPPYYQPVTPSEIYIPEQNQAYGVQQSVYAPQAQMPVFSQGTAQTIVQGQEMIIYPNRKQAIFRVSVCVSMAIFILGIFVFALATNGPIQPSDVAPMIATLLIVIVGVILLSWLSWSTGFQQLRDPKPMLVINQMGITVGKALLLSGFSISWAEIEAINSSRYLYKYFCIVPRNPDQFLTRFTPWERFMRRMNAMIGSPLYLPQVFLSKPVEDIIQELYHRYANELNYYRVQLRS